MATKYEFEIYEPGSVDDVWITFSSSTPFMPINAGDLLNPGIWPNSQSPMKILRVVNIEHLIWEVGSGITQKVLIFTQEVEGTREVRRIRDLDV